MSEIEASLEESERKLGLDIDSYLPESVKLSRVYNFLRVFPDGALARNPYSGGLHLKAEHPSSLTLREGLGDDSGRIWVSSQRGGDCLFKWKGKFKLLRTKNGRRIIWVQRPVAYEECTSHDLLAKPFFSKATGRMRK